MSEPAVQEMHGDHSNHDQDSTGGDHHGGGGKEEATCSPMHVPKSDANLMDSAEQPQENHSHVTTRKDLHHSPEKGGLDKRKNHVEEEDDETAQVAAGFFSSDAFQRILVTINVLVAVYSAAMAAGLSVFVPQRCCHPEAYDDFGKCINVTTGEDMTDQLRICTFSENVDFKNNSAFNNYVLAMNIATLLVMLAVFVIEYWRENFLISCLDIDATKVDDHLKIKVFPKGKFPRLQASLRWHNQVYFWAYVVSFVVWIVNAVSSAVLVFRFYYLDTRTATSFLTNNLLLLTRFAKGYGVASDSLSNERGISFYTAKQVTFNAVDKDYKRKYLPGGKKYRPPPAGAPPPAPADAPAPASPREPAPPAAHPQSPAGFAAV